MKKQVRYNLILLVYTHLFLFIFPLAVKALHTHHFKNINYCYTNGVAGDGVFQNVKDCPICDYELLSFITEEPVSLDINCFAYPVTVSSLPEKVNLAPVFHFSLRAPPTV